MSRGCFLISNPFTVLSTDGGDGGHPPDASSQRPKRTSPRPSAGGVNTRPFLGTRPRRTQAFSGSGLPARCAPRQHAASRAHSCPSGGRGAPGGGDAISQAARPLSPPSRACLADAPPLHRRTRVRASPAPRNGVADWSTQGGERLDFPQPCCRASSWGGVGRRVPGGATPAGGAPDARVATPLGQDQTPTSDVSPPDRPKELLDFPPTVDGLTRHRSHPQTKTTRMMLLPLRARIPLYRHHVSPLSLSRPSKSSGAENTKKARGDLAGDASPAPAVDDRSLTSPATRRGKTDGSTFRRAPEPRGRSPAARLGEGSP